MGAMSRCNSLLSSAGSQGSQGGWGDGRQDQATLSRAGGSCVDVRALLGNPHHPGTPCIASAQIQTKWGAQSHLGNSFIASTHSEWRALLLVDDKLHQLPMQDCAPKSRTTPKCVKLHVFSLPCQLCAVCECAKSKIKIMNGWRP